MRLFFWITSLNLLAIVSINGFLFSGRQDRANISISGQHQRALLLRLTSGTSRHVTSSAFIPMDGDGNERMKQHSHALPSTTGVPDLWHLHGHIDYEEFLDEDERLCVVVFTAKFCKKCQKLMMRWPKLIREKGDLVRRGNDANELIKKGNVRFAEVEFGENQVLCERLGVDKVPFVRMYKDGHLLTAFDCGASTGYPMVEAYIKAFDI